MIILALLASSVATGDCSKAPSGVDYRACLGKLSETVDAQLAQQWQRTLAAVRREDRANKGQNKPELERSLVASQKSWASYRDAECQMVSDQAAGGTGIGEVWANCRIALTRARIDVLKRRAESKLRTSPY